MSKYSPDEEEYRRSLGGSEFDQMMMSTEDLEGAANIRNMMDAGLISTDAGHTYVEDQYRKKYGYSGGRDGSEYQPLNTYEQPTYKDKYGSTIDSLVDEYLGRRKFSYDPETDPIYQYYLNQYTRGGKQAMNDMYGQLSARTGGLGSTASQNAYNKYMEAAADKIPELYKLAWDMYRQEGQDRLQALNTLQDLSNTDYSRFNTDRNFDYGVWGDQRSYDTSERNAAINRVVDYYSRGGKTEDLDENLIDTSSLTYGELGGLEDYNTRLAQSAQAEADAKAAAEAKARVDDYLSKGGLSANLDPEIIAASGYTKAELAAYEKYYKDELARKNKTGRSSSGSSRRSSSGSGSSGDSILDSMPDGMTEGEAKIWLRENGGKLTEGAIKDYVELYMEMQGDDSEEGGFFQDSIDLATSIAGKYSNVLDTARSMLGGNTSSTKGMSEGSRRKAVEKYLNGFSEDQLPDDVLDRIIRELGL